MGHSWSRGDYSPYYQAVMDEVARDRVKRLEKEGLNLGDLWREVRDYHVTLPSPQLLKRNWISATSWKALQEANRNVGGYYDPRRRPLIVVVHPRSAMIAVEGIYALCTAQSCWFLDPLPPDVILGNDGSGMYRGLRGSRRWACRCYSPPLPVWLQEGAIDLRGLLNTHSRDWVEYYMEAPLFTAEDIEPYREAGYHVPEKALINVLDW